MKIPRAVQRRLPFVALLLGVAIAARAQTVTPFVSFDYTDGAAPDTLVQNTDGNFYSTTFGGGPNCYGAGGCGAFFRLTPTGGLIDPLYFSGANGGYPNGVFLASDGDFYGTAEGGAYGLGTIFKITSGGVLTDLHDFCAQRNALNYCTDGNYPYAPVIQATDGNFYGTTGAGGAYGEGTIFKMTPAGVLTTLYSFCAKTGCPDGAGPSAALLEGADGNLYGTAPSGGANLEGVIFKITTSGRFTTFHSFGGGNDGSTPMAPLIQATDGNFYGTTEGGGGGGGIGTVFKITPAGEEAVLYSFCTQPTCDDGSTPSAPLIQATDGNFYGTTSGSGVNYETCEGEYYGICGGTVFQITPQGTLTTLYAFCADFSNNICIDGSTPVNGMSQATSGLLYGTTRSGGAYNDGSIFTLSMGLAPFVQALPAVAKTGVSIHILGNSLKGATAVSFNGTAATFKVNSSSEITTTVPAGATTGLVQVTTPAGNLNSNVAFRVLPQVKSFTPASGPVGAPVTITGVSLTQTTAVAFDGVNSAFTVDSDTQVTATVPTRAKTGKISITTTGGTATTTTNFTVTAP